ncbi:SDR family NAD(P)-dependent oxidoreductase [Streptomyces sp. 71268]|uniref:SDR family NAD(P)-dependent oxidoreductase n=1 Tax=Streptomyces sp. 71268 TaxID=3002640 RepID=UPI0023F7D5B5|nr:SDR family NAD(P)-dependent oxidoreductase [Streptomyces sp. 71268]WEV29336.1 SDR family NAD(P)-dependent oxidoreductase [Streptomyces sp. 71268]
MTPQPAHPTRPVVLVASDGTAAAEELARQLAAGGAHVVPDHSGDPLAAAARQGRIDALVTVTTGSTSAAHHALSATLPAATLAALAGRGCAAIVHVAFGPAGPPQPARDAERATDGHPAPGSSTPSAEPVAGERAPVRTNTVHAPTSAAGAVAPLVGFLLGPDAGALDGRALTLTGEAAPAPGPSPTTTPPPATVSPRPRADPAPAGPAPADDEVVVVGMGLAVPGASSPEAFWDLLRTGEPMFGEPGDRLDLDTLWSADPAAEDKTYARVAGFMRDFVPHPRLREEIASGRFASDEFTARWLRHSLLQATDGVTIRPRDRHLFAVGLTPDGSHHLEQSLVTTGVRGLLGAVGADVPAGLDALYPLGAAAPHEVLPHRIARLAAPDLPPDAEIVVVDTACSSSLYTIDLGVRALRAGECDVALCGGAFALSAQSMVLFAKLHGLSRTGEVRALDAGAGGVLFSDGAAMLTLKTYARARADGDPVLGFVAGFGGSSDGRGKAIYAPNAAGQRIALDRAWAQAGAGPADVDWVVAHATGTPTGDRTEMTALGQSAGPGKTWTMTSNKSLVGHAGWAAGAVSAIHALLALRHGAIPAQSRFAALPADVAASVEVPTRERPWPARPERRRLVGVSAMGFGGTNGHLLLSDRPRGGDHRTGAPSPATHTERSAADAAPLASGPRAGAADAASPDACAPAVPDGAYDPVVVVVTGIHLPDLPDAVRVRRWLAGGAPDWPATFGDAYPMPSPVEARIAPSALAALDRSQVMALRCADALAGDWLSDAALRDRTGVFVGHTGPTRSALAHDLRCYLSDLTAKLTDPAGLPPALLGDAVRALTPPTSEDSYPGLMPNIIAARVVQRLDLHGPNMTLDAGADSTHSALATAVRYLRDGELDLAVVMGVNAVSPLLPGPDGRQAADAAVGHLLTRLSVARAQGLPVLGTLAIVPPAAPDATERGARRHAADDARDYRGADGAVALLRALHAPGDGVLLRPTEDAHTPALRVSAPPDAARVGDTARVADAAREPDARPAPVARAEQAVGGAEASLAEHLTRHAVTLRPVLPRPIRAALPALPAGALVVTDDPAAVAAHCPPDCLVVVPASAASTASGAYAAPPGGPTVLHLDDAAELPAALATRGRAGAAQVRVVVGAYRAEPGREAADADDVPRRLLDLHDLAFVAAQSCAGPLRDGGCYAVLALDALDGPVPRPRAGLFGGLVRSLEQELPGALVYALFTDAADADTGLTQLAAESTIHRHLPLAYQSAGQRGELTLIPVREDHRAGAADRPRPADLGLPADPVIVATGGARGLTAHLVHEIVAAGAPRSVWLIGTGPEPDPSDVELAALPKVEAVRRLMPRHPGENLAALGRRYERAVQQAERAETLRALTEVCGPDRVHYRQCDVLDADAVDRVIGEVLAREGRVDVLLHGAGLARSAALERKRLADFRAVRDVKVRGHAHLRAALRDHRPALWCSLSSVSAFTGLRGEPDYGAANEFLLLAAAQARASGWDEVALVSGLWVESGMASADTPGGAFLARQAEIGQLTDAQGRAFYRTELAGRGSHGLATTWIGDLDWATLERSAPGFRAACRALAEAAPEPPRAAPPRPPARAFLTDPPRPVPAGGAPAAEAQSASPPAPSVWDCEVSLDRHPYLLDHLVDGRPTVPGTFILELAAEAAAELAPGLVPVRITDVVLSQFIRAARHRWPRTLRVTATTEGPGRIRVRVTSPPQGPVPEREHTRMVVHLARSAPVGPWGPPPIGHGTPAPNTYRLPDTPVRLGGVFDALSEPRFQPDGGSATLCLAPVRDSAPFDGFLLPSLALDCLLRTCVLDGRRPGPVPVLVPTALASVDLFTTANDRELAATYPDGLVLRHWFDAATGDECYAALAPDGRVLLQVTGVSGAVKGWYDAATASWRGQAPAATAPPGPPA